MASPADFMHFRSFTQEERDEATEQLVDARLNLLAELECAEVLEGWRGGDPLELIRARGIADPYLLSVADRFRAAALTVFEANMPLAVQRSRYHAKRNTRQMVGLFDEVEQDLFYSMWESILHYDPSYGTRPSTYIVNGFRWPEMQYFRAIPLSKQGQQVCGEYVIDLFPSREEEPDKELIIQDQKDYLNELLQCLCERERNVVIGRMQGKSLQEIGKEIGMSKERVRQIYESSMKKLRDQGDNPQPVLFVEEILA